MTNGGTAKCFDCSHGVVIFVCGVFSCEFQFTLALYASFFIEISCFLRTRSQPVELLNGVAMINVRLKYCITQKTGCRVRARDSHS